MPQADFYTLKQSSDDHRDLFACRLVEKAFGLGNRIFIQAESETAARRLDELLWNFRPESFIPHGVQDHDDDDEEMPVVIGFAGDCKYPAELLINLSPVIPVFYRDFPRIAEIVLNNELSRQLSRKHWRHYQEQGWELKHHQV
ncbi:MAG: DNA polymerase III subunit chi [Pseudomonadales bacterium]|nr:DNA polymerase III subunit chi [Pseudomonadales bacterium]